jgi:NAD(P)-dependent dehydrogenase (short-subunit alcohol dehydrogenase family)
VTPLFDGQLALVTGAGRGIGRAIALELAAAGARVALLARSVDELDEVAAAVRDRGGTAGVFPADAADPAQVAGAMTRITAEMGRVSILISNAAVVWPLGPTVTVTLAEWQAAFAVNVGAVVQLSTALLPPMLEQGWGRIVNVSSGIAAHPAGMIGGNAYATTKAALEAHTINLAAELAGSGVTVNVYRPGSVDTAMQAWIRAQSPEKIGAPLHERFARSYEEGSLITAGQSARSLMDHLASDATGEIWNVNSNRPVK